MIRAAARSVPSDWTHLLGDHARAVEEYRAAAGSLDPAAWRTPIAPGKWTPAEITAHVAQAYRVLNGELQGAAGMRMLGSGLQRLLLRHTILPRLLSGKPFPPGVRAPRETRPSEVMEDPALALENLAALAERFGRELAERAAGHVRLTHAYFGALSPQQGLKLSTMHTRHHAQQLAAINRSSLPS
jgi:hypothetical protein